MNHLPLIEELRETRSVDEANVLLHTGWRLLTITANWRGHTYILGARTAVETTAQAPSALPASPNPKPCPAEGDHDHA